MIGSNVVDQAKLGLPVFKGETFEAHIDAWLILAEEIEDHRWQLAAVAASLGKRYGEDVAGKFASEVGVSAETVRRYARAYRAFQNARRSPILTLTHHAIAARFRDPQRAIEVAEDEGHSTRDMEVRAEAEALPEPEREAVIRVADERKFTAAETKNLVRARLERLREVESASREVVGPMPEEDEEAEVIEEIESEEDEETTVESDADAILEVCSYCGAPSSAWAKSLRERRPRKP